METKKNWEWQPSCLRHHNYLVNCSHNNIVHIVWLVTCLINRLQVLKYSLIIIKFIKKTEKKNSWGYQNRASGFRWTFSIPFYSLSSVLRSSHVTLQLRWDKIVLSSISTSLPHDHTPSPPSALVTTFKMKQSRAGLFNKTKGLIEVKLNKKLERNWTSRDQTDRATTKKDMLKPSLYFPTQAQHSHIHSAYAYMETLIVLRSSCILYTCAQWVVLIFLLGLSKLTG